jgi:hypothetical protein
LPQEQKCSWCIHKGYRKEMTIACSSFPFWSDRGNGWPSERALSRHGLRGERLAAGWAGLAITKSNTAREALACFGTPDDLLIAVRQGFLTQDLVGSFAGRLNMLG